MVKQRSKSLSSLDIQSPSIPFRRVVCYQLYFQEQKSRLGILYPFLTQEQINLKIKERWNHLENSQKQNYTKAVLSATKLRKPALTMAYSTPKRSFTKQNGLFGTDIEMSSLMSTSPSSVVSSQERVQDWLNDPKQIHHSRKVLPNSKKYDGTQYALNYSIPNIIEETISKATGILKNKGNSSEVKIKSKQKSRVSFSPRSKKTNKQSTEKSKRSKNGGYFQNGPYTGRQKNILIKDKDVFDLEDENPMNLEANGECKTKTLNANRELFHFENFDNQQNKEPSPLKSELNTLTSKNIKKRKSPTLKCGALNKIKSQKCEYKNDKETSDHLSSKQLRSQQDTSALMSKQKHRTRTDSPEVKQRLQSSHNNNLNNSPNSDTLQDDLSSDSSSFYRNRKGLLIGPILHDDDKYMPTDVSPTNSDDHQDYCTNNKGLIVGPICRKTFTDCQTFTKDEVEDKYVNPVESVSKKEDTITEVFPKQIKTYAHQHQRKTSSDTSHRQRTPSSDVQQKQRTTFSDIEHSQRALQRERASRASSQIVRISSDAPQRGKTYSNASQKGKTSSEPPRGKTSSNASPRWKTSSDAPQKGKTSSEPPRGKTSSDAPQKGKTSSEPPRGKTSSDAPQRGKTSIDAPLKGKTSSDAPQKGKTSSDAPQKGKTSSDAPQKGKTSSEPPRGKTSSDAPHKGKTSSNAQQRGRTSSDAQPSGRKSRDEHQREKISSDAQQKERTASRELPQSRRTRSNAKPDSRGITISSDAHEKTSSGLQARHRKSKDAPQRQRTQSDVTPGKHSKDITKSNDAPQKQRTQSDVKPGKHSRDIKSSDPHLKPLTTNTFYSNAKLTQFQKPKDKNRTTPNSELTVPKLNCSTDKTKPDSYKTLIKPDDAMDGSLMSSVAQKDKHVVPVSNINDNFLSCNFDEIQLPKSLSPTNSTEWESDTSVKDIDSLSNDSRMSLQMNQSKITLANVLSRFKEITSPCQLSVESSPRILSPTLSGISVLSSSTESSNQSEKLMEESEPNLSPNLQKRTPKYETTSKLLCTSQESSNSDNSQQSPNSQNRKRKSRYDIIPEKITKHAKESNNLLCELFNDMTPPEKKRPNPKGRRLVSSNKEEKIHNFSKLFEDEDDIFL